MIIMLKIKKYMKQLMKTEMDKKREEHALINWEEHDLTYSYRPQCWNDLHEEDHATGYQVTKF